jgi:predicted permease
MIFLGWWMARKQWFASSSIDSLTKLILNVSLPCSMFANIVTQFSRAEFLDLIRSAFIPALSIAITHFIGLAVRRVFKVAPRDYGKFLTMFVCSNTIFIGLPINLAIFGAKALPYVLIYYICNTVYFWTFGVYQIKADGTEFSKGLHNFEPKKLARQVLSPALIGFSIGIVWVLLSLPKLKNLMQLTGELGSLTSALSLIVIGIMVYFIGWRNLKLTKEVVLVMFGRFILAPLTIIIIEQFFKMPHLMASVFIIQSSLPIPNSVSLLARRYNAGEELPTATLGICVLTYLFVIPILLLIIN